MKKTMISLVSLISMFFFVGYAANQPYSKSQNTPQYTNSFNPNDKRLVFVERKPFDVPRNANYSPRRATSEEAKSYRNVGIACNMGDLFWMYGYKRAELSELIRKGYVQCAYPLGSQEYQYRLNQEKRRRVLEELAGFNTQKIKVEHSGSINHNIVTK